MLPDAEAQHYCEAGLDKDGFEVKYISDYKGSFFFPLILIFLLIFE